MAFNLESELLFVQSNPTLSDKPKTHPTFSVANLRFCESYFPDRISYFQSYK
jgi:hypothetical protein